MTNSFKYWLDGMPVPETGSGSMKYWIDGMPVGEIASSVIDLKSINSVAWPSMVKTVNGVAKASVKTYNGVLA